MIVKHIFAFSLILAMHQLTMGPQALASAGCSGANVQSIDRPVLMTDVQTCFRFQTARLAKAYL